MQNDYRVLGTQKKLDLQYVLYMLEVHNSRHSRILMEKYQLELERESFMEQTWFALRRKVFPGFITLSRQSSFKSSCIRVLWNRLEVRARGREADRFLPRPNGVQLYAMKSCAHKAVRRDLVVQPETVICQQTDTA